jgi:hypothetical protein
MEFSTIPRGAAHLPFDPLFAAVQHPPCHHQRDRLSHPVRDAHSELLRALGA